MNNRIGIILLLALVTLGCRNVVIGGSPADACDAISRDGLGTAITDGATADTASDATISGLDSGMHHMDGGPQTMDVDHPMGPMGAGGSMMASR